MPCTIPYLGLCQRPPRLSLLGPSIFREKASLGVNVIDFLSVFLASSHFLCGQYKGEDFYQIKILLGDHMANLSEAKKYKIWSLVNKELAQSTKHTPDVPGALAIFTNLT